MSLDDSHGGTKMFRPLRLADYSLFSSQKHWHDARHSEDSTADEGLPSDLIIDPPKWEADQ